MDIRLSSIFLLRLPVLQSGYRRFAGSLFSYSPSWLRFRGLLHIGANCGIACQSASSLSGCTLSVRYPRVGIKSFSPCVCHIYCKQFHVVLWLRPVRQPYPYLQSHVWFLSVRPEIRQHLPSDSASRQTLLVFRYPLPTTGQVWDFHSLGFAHAERTHKETGSHDWLPVWIIITFIFLWLLAALRKPSVHFPVRQDLNQTTFWCWRNGYHRRRREKVPVETP